MSHQTYTFKDELKKRLQDPSFAHEWEKSEPEFVLACQIIEQRKAQNISQRELAQRAHTTQAVISRIETMNANPSFDLVKRIAHVLNVPFSVRLG